MNSYKTKDGSWLFLTGLEADRHIESVCRALGREDLLDDPRFADARAIRKNRVEVIATLDEIIVTESLDVWAERFDDAGVWWAPAQGPAAVLEDPQLLANDGIVELGQDGGGPKQRSVNGPVSFSDARVRPSAPAPNWASTPTTCSPSCATWTGGTSAGRRSVDARSRSRSLQHSDGLLAVPGVANERLLRAASLRPTSGGMTMKVEAVVLPLTATVFPFMVSMTHELRPRPLGSSELNHGALDHRGPG